MIWLAGALFVWDRDVAEADEVEKLTKFYKSEKWDPLHFATF